MNPIKHIRKWNRWRKMNLNSPLHKFLVLIGFVKSPSFEHFYDTEEIKNHLRLLGFDVTNTYRD